MLKSFSKMGLKIWVLTVDKMELTVNIRWENNLSYELPLKFDIIKIWKNGQLLIWKDIAKLIGMKMYHILCLKKITDFYLMF